jgi:hypothetical protein
MIKLKTLLYTILLIVSVGFTKKTLAQTGATCASAYSLSISPGQNTGWETTAYDTVWYDFVAPNTTCNFRFHTSLENRICIKNIKNGVCGIFENVEMLYQENDSSFYLNYVGLTYGNHYKIALVFGLSGNCETCSNIGTYKIDFVQATTSGSLCAATCPVAPDCDYLCNGSFEQINAIPSAISQLNFACDWYSGNTGGTPDLYSTQTGWPASIPQNYLGYENVRVTGQESYAGFTSQPGGFNEALVAPLTATLQNNRTYNITFYLSLAEAAVYNTNNVGFAFANNYVQATGNNLFGTTGATVAVNTASVTKNGWVGFSYNYLANGTETHFIIGAINGNYTAGTAPVDFGTTYFPPFTDDYYYIDDISIKETFNFSVTPSPCYTLSTITITPSIASSYTWSSAPPTPTLSSQSGPIITVSPSVTTTYSASAMVAGCALSGTVTVLTTPITFTSSSQTFCAGTTPSISLTASGLTTYSWSSHPSITGSLNSPTITVSPTATTTYTLLGNLSGCSNTFSSTITISDETPIISLTSSTLICSGTEFNVSVPSTAFITSVDFGDPSNPLNNTLAPYTYTANGNYTITASAISINGCASFSTFPVSVTTLTSSSISYTQQPCSYTYTISQNFNCSNINESSGVWIYATSNPTLDISGSGGALIPNGTYTFTFPGTGTYTVGAISVPSMLTATTVITVTSYTIPTISISASPSFTLCSGNSTTLTASGASTYTWSSGATTNSIVVTPTVNSAYAVTGTNGSGCINTSTVMVYVTSGPTITSIPSTSIVCPGASATLTATGGTSYTWSLGSTLNTTSGSSVIATPTANTTYTVVAATTCGNFTNTIFISLTPAPSLSVSPSVTICKNTSTTLTASGATTYTWNPGGLTGSSVVVTPTIATTYTVTGANSCSATSTQTVKVSFFKGFPSITATASPTFICAGSSSTLTMTGGGSLNGWLGGLACGGTTCVVSPSVTTTYTASTTSTVNGCTNTTTVTVVVGPFTSITANPVSVCSGQTATLTASGATTYTWYPGGTVYTATTVVTPTVTSNYTVTGTNGSCPSGTVVLTVTVNASPTITVNSPTICTSGTATLTASGGTAYTWAPGGSTSVSITVSPTVTTTYTVTGTSALGCTATAVSTVNISNGSIPSFSIVSPTGTICANGSGISPTTFSTTLGTNPLYGFAWIPGFSTSASPTIAITQPVSVKVTVTNLACGTSSVQDICVNYVASTCCNSTLTTLTNTTITNVSQIPNAMYRVVGTLTIDLVSGSLALGSKEFLMSTGSKITVTPTTTLQINACKFYSCSGMWEGIELQNTASAAATIFIDDGTIIEDAYRALSVVASTTNIAPIISIGQNTTFNKNYTDVYLQDWVSSGNTYPFETIKSNYTSQTSSTSPGGNLKCSQYYTPTIKARSAAGIYAVDATSVNVSSTGASTVNANYFNNKDYGVLLQRTSGLVTNALFNNMAGTIGSGTVLPTGVGVYATTNSNTPTTLSVTTVSAAVTFSNVQCAVYTKKATNLYVLNTTITNPNQSNWSFIIGGSGYGYNGVYTEDIKRDLHVNYNTINNTWYGVQTAYTGTANIAILSISNNTILATTSTKTVSTGINISSAMAFNGSPTNMPIAANTLSNVTTGIKLTGLGGGVRVSGNDITMKSGNTAGAAGSGVYLAGGNTYCKIDNNNIHGNSTVSEGFYNINKIGFNIKTSTNCLLQCNRMDYLGTGVRFDGVCTTTNTGFFANEINYPIRRGLDLRNSASIGTQGTYTGTPPSHTVLTTSENKWGGGTWNASITDQTWVYDAGSSALNSRLCTNNAGPELPTDNQWNTGSPNTAAFLDTYATSLNSLLTSATATAVTTCPLALTVGAKLAGTTTNDSLATELRDEEYNRIITENLTDPMIPDESKWQLKEYMYRNLADGAAPNDVIVQGFYNQEKTGTINNFTVVDSLINTGDYNQAIAINASANTAIITEQTTKDYNTLWLSKFSDPDYVATSADIFDLENIANVCIHKGGKAVAYARALLGAIYNHPSDYNDDCMDYKDNARKAKNVKTFETLGNDVLLFPNPNNGNFTLKYDFVKDITEAEVMVEDVTGKLIYAAKLNVTNRSINMDLSNTRNGIYFVKVISNKEIISVNKVIINN